MATLMRIFIKQNCELKAAYRLIDDLKKMFPRLKICLLFDGLYPNEKIFKLCKQHGFKYIMTFPEDKIPTLFERYQEFKKLDNLEIKKKTIEFSLEHAYSHKPDKPDKPEKLLIVSKIFLLKLQEYF